MLRNAANAGITAHLPFATVLPEDNLMFLQQDLCSRKRVFLLRTCQKQSQLQHCLTFLEKDSLSPASGHGCFGLKPNKTMDVNMAWLLWSQHRPSSRLRLDALASQHTRPCTEPWLGLVLFAQNTIDHKQNLNM